MVQSHWSTHSSDLVLWFMLVLCMSLVFFVLFGYFFGGSFPSAGYLRVSLSVPHLLFSLVQVWAGCVGDCSSVCTRF